MGGRAGRAKIGKGERGSGGRERLRGEDEGGDEECGLALGKLRDDAKLVVVGVGRGGFAVGMVVPGGAGRGGGGRVVRGVFGGVDEGVPLRARGENRQHQHQRRTRQRGEAREERKRGVTT